MTLLKCPECGRVYDKQTGREHILEDSLEKVKTGENPCFRCEDGVENRDEGL